MQVFVSYNTDSIIEKSHSKKFIKIFSKNFLDAKSKKGNVIFEYKDFFIKEYAKNIFAAISDYLKNSDSTKSKQKNGYEYYFDIVNNKQLSGAQQMDNKANQLQFISRNEKEIKESKVLVYVVSSEEISFWQLQEFFVSKYYGIKYILLTTEKFLSLVSKNKLSSYLTKKLK